MKNFTLSVNGDERRVKAEPDTPLLYVMRNDLDLKGASEDGKSPKLVCCPLIGSLREWTPTEPGEGRRGDA